jgi:hypothetical protein
MDPIEEGEVSDYVYIVANRVRRRVLLNLARKEMGSRQGRKNSTEKRPT